jgi:hypothetical protein
MPRFVTLMLIGLAMAAVVLVVGAVTGGWYYVVPTLIVIAIVVAMAITYRLVAERGPGRAGQSDVPRVPTDDSRPLGDTPQAHDEITPRDIPKYNAAARHAAEAETDAPGDTLRGHREGGAGGEGGPEENDGSQPVAEDEAQGARFDRERPPTHTGRSES